MYKTKCESCGYAHIIVGDLGLNWVMYSFKCDHCGGVVTIRRVFASDDDIRSLKEELSDMKNVDDFLAL